MTEITKKKLTKFFKVSFRKSRNILDQFNKSVKSYNNMFEAVALLASPPRPPDQVVLMKK